MNKFTILLGFVLLFGLSCGNQERKAAEDKPLQKQPEKPGHYNSTTKNSDTLNLEHYKRSDFSKALQNGTRILESPDWFVWGCSPILDEDGKVHVFFSRWPESFGNWLTKSEIAHAVADNPEGPYKIIGTVLKGRGGDYWDAHTIHNPTVQKVGDQYVMFYIGNNLDRAKDFDGHNASTQRIGMAVTKDLNGEWKRVGEEPILDVSGSKEQWDSYLTTNPAFLQHPNGESWLYYKAWDRYNDNLRKMGLAVANDPKGPYEKYDQNPVVNFSEMGKQVEDAYVFYYAEKQKFYMIMRDMGVIHPHVGLLLESEDGLNWSDPQLGYSFNTDYLINEDKIVRFERPQVLMKDGKPSYLFLAASGGSYQKSSAVVIKIDNEIF